MLDYGLLDGERGGDVIYMRSYGDAPFSYVTSKGDAAFVGIGFRAASREALDQLRAKFGSGVAECPHPGGGLYVVGSDPDERRADPVERRACEEAAARVPASGLWALARPAPGPCRAADASAAREDRLVLRDARDETVGAHLQG